MQPIGCVSLVRQEQQADRHLCDQYRLGQDEQVPPESARLSPAPQRQAAEQPCEQRDGQDGNRHKRMGSEHDYDLGMPTLERGQPAPDFELPDESGQPVRLSSFRGSPVVLYFYPRSDTPGCTRQASGIRDDYGRFEERGAVVLGVSVDTEASQARFKKKYGLPFTLLADPERTTGDLYGVTQEGRSSYARSTFLIDREGNVAKVMQRVDPGTHTERVLEALPD